MAHSICGTLSPFTHRPRFLTRPPSLLLSSRTQAFNHERNIVAIPHCLSSSALDGSREPRRDVGRRGEIQKIGWRPPNLKPKTKKVVRYTPIRHTPMRHTPMRHTPIRYRPMRYRPMKVLRGSSASERRRTSVQLQPRFRRRHIWVSVIAVVSQRPLFRTLHGLLGYQRSSALFRPICLSPVCPSLFCRSDWLANPIACASFSPPHPPSL